MIIKGPDSNIIQGFGNFLRPHFSATLSQRAQRLLMPKLVLLRSCLRKCIWQYPLKEPATLSSTESTEIDIYMHEKACRQQKRKFQSRLQSGNNPNVHRKWISCSILIWAKMTHQFKWISYCYTQWGSLHNISWKVLHRVLYREWFHL